MPVATRCAAGKGPPTELVAAELIRPPAVTGRAAVLTGAPAELTWASAELRLRSAELALLVATAIGAALARCVGVTRLPAEARVPVLPASERGRLAAGEFAPLATAEPAVAGPPGPKATIAWLAGRVAAIVVLAGGVAVIARVAGSPTAEALFARAVEGLPGAEVVLAGPATAGAPAPGWPPGNRPSLACPPGCCSAG